MIRFDDFYAFPAQEVEAVATDSARDDSCPYRLTVYLRSGRSIGVKYETETDRDKAMTSLVDLINNELNGTDRIADIQLRLNAINDTYQRVEKRQLRIFRMVKKLLARAENGPGEGEDL